MPASIEISIKFNDASCLDLTNRMRQAKVPTTACNRCFKNPNSVIAKEHLFIVLYTIDYINQLKFSSP
jgi:hypothetical protein